MPTESDIQVAAARSALRQLLSRRDFLTAATVAAASASGLSLTACGSSPTTATDPPPAPPPPPPPGSGGIPDGAKQITGTVALPPGSSLDLSTLSVAVLTQTAAVSASGGFTAGISPTGPSLAMLVDADGEGVLGAVFDPAATSHTITTRTTAVTLLFTAVGGYLFSAATMSKILSLLDGDPAIAALNTAIANAVGSDAHALANNAPNIAPAMTHALNTILGSSVRTQPERAAALARLDGPPTLMIVQPFGDQSGVTMDQDATTTSLLISNEDRRPSRVYIYETSTEAPVQGQPRQRNISPPALVQGPVDLDSTENLSLFTEVKDLLHGTTPWLPVKLPPIPLALAPNHDNTTYEIVVINASYKTLTPLTSDPPFFADAYWGPVVPTWRVDAHDLIRDTLLGNLLLPTVCFLIGAGPIVVTALAARQAIAAAAAVYRSTQQALLSDLVATSIAEGREGFAKALVRISQGDLAGEMYKGETVIALGRIEAQALAAQTAALFATTLAASLRTWLTILLAPGLALEAADIGKILFDLLNSEIGETWTADLVKQKLRLSPQDPIVASGDRVHFAITPPVNITGTFEYDWTQNSPYAVLSSESDGRVGTMITTTSLAVDLVTLPSDVNPVNVRVVGYDVSSGSRVEIGQAGTTVKFVLPALILGADKYFSRGEHRTLTASVNGVVGAGARYRWTLTGTAGSIGATNVVTTDTPAINYLAGVTGVDSLHVDVLDPSGGIIAKGDATLHVVGDNVIQFDISGTWDPEKTPANGSYSYNDVVAGREPSPGGAGLDAIFIGGNLVGPDRTIGALVTIVVPSGAALREGEVLHKFIPNQLPAANQFQLTLSQDQHDVENSTQYAAGNGGALVIDAIGQLVDGTFVINYSFDVTNGGGGLIVGSGAVRL